MIQQDGPLVLDTVEEVDDSFIPCFFQTVRQEYKGNLPVRFYAATNTVIRKGNPNDSVEVGLYTRDFKRYDTITIYGFYSINL